MNCDLFNLLHGVNGFDGVFINDATGEVIINESKQWTSGSFSLNGLNQGTNWPAQMTDDWVDAAVDKLRDANKHDVADTIADAKSAVPPKLTKIVTVVDRIPAGNSNGMTGGINILKVE